MGGGERLVLHRVGFPCQPGSQDGRLACRTYMRSGEYTSITIFGIMTNAIRTRMVHGEMSEAMERSVPASFENLWKPRDESKTASSATEITWKRITRPITDRVDQPKPEVGDGGAGELGLGATVPSVIWCRRTIDLSGLPLASTPPLRSPRATSRSVATMSW